MKQLAISSSMVWGVDRHDKVYYTKGTRGSWTGVPGVHLRQLAVSGNAVWGVNANDEILYTQDSGANWAVLPGKLKQVASEPGC